MLLYLTAALPQVKAEISASIVTCSSNHFPPVTPQWKEGDNDNEVKLIQSAGEAPRTQCSDVFTGSRFHTHSHIQSPLTQIYHETLEPPATWYFSDLEELDTRVLWGQKTINPSPQNGKNVDRDSQTFVGQLLSLDWMYCPPFQAVMTERKIIATEITSQTSCHPARKQNKLLWLMSLSPDLPAPTFPLFAMSVLR